MSDVKTLLLGMGNPIVSDDAVGIMLARDVGAALGPRPGVDVIDECSIGGLNLLDLVAGYDRLVDVLLADVFLTDDLEEARAVWLRSGGAATVVTRQGEAIDRMGAMSGGSEPPLEETLLARARELRELDVTLAETQVVAERQHRILQELQERSTLLATRVRAEEERSRAVELALVGLRKDAEQLEEEQGRLAAELEVAALESGRLTAMATEVEGELRAAREGRVRLADTLERQRRELRSRMETFARWRETCQGIEADRTRAAITMASIAERRRAAEEAQARLRATFEELTAQVATTDRQAAEISAQAASVHAELERLAAIRHEAEEAANRLSAERDALAGEIAATDAALAELEARQQEARARLEVLHAERSACDVAMAERRVALEQLAERLMERYGLGCEALDAAEAPPLMFCEDDAARTEELRARLARLGDVNPGAVAELAEVQQRYEFLATQRADLERSVDDLRKTIARLTRMSRQRFEETFAAANEKLAEVFPQLFPGGKARLVLVPGEEG